MEMNKINTIELTSHFTANINNFSNLSPLKMQEMMSSSHITSVMYKEIHKAWSFQSWCQQKSIKDFQR